MHPNFCWGGRTNPADIFSSKQQLRSSRVQTLDRPELSLATGFLPFWLSARSRRHAPRNCQAQAKFPTPFPSMNRSRLPDIASAHQPQNPGRRFSPGYSRSLCANRRKTPARSSELLQSPAQSACAHLLTKPSPQRSRLVSSVTARARIPA
jgi:hypothetical protein